MKTKMVIVIMVFWLFSSMSLNAQSRPIEWNTFMGSTGVEYCFDVVWGSTGNIYVTGRGSQTWGTPVNAHSGGYDIIVACLDSSGNLQWNTFLGSANDEYAYGIAVDGSDNVYVAGYIKSFDGTWDCYVAKLNSSGTLLWGITLGADYFDDYGSDLIPDGSGNVFVCGSSEASWGFPVNAHAGGHDVFVAKLDNTGSLVWNTFMGSSTGDHAYGCTLDSSGNIVVTGISDSSWGSPVSAYSGDYDIVVAKLNSSGSLLWNTFLGSSQEDWSDGVTTDSSGNIFITGYSTITWGLPVNAFNGATDAIIASLDNNGNLQWHTFLGSISDDYGYDIALDGSGNVYVTGHSNMSWGTPGNPHSGGWDAFVVILTASGSLLTNTFLGCTANDLGHGITLDTSGHVYVAGSGYGTWGSPINPHSGDRDIFAARFYLYPLCDILANGSEGPISITESDTLQIKVSLNRFGMGDNVDYWLAYKGPSGWVHYNNVTKKWETGLGVTHQGPLMDLNNKKVFQSTLSPGNYTFYFGVDMNMDGKVTKSSLYKGEVQITVTQ